MDEKQRGIRSTNREFIGHDQVRKPHTYHLAEQGAGEEAFDESHAIRTCDMALLHGDADDRARFAQQIGQALEEIGFAVLTGTGVDPALYDEATERTIELFEDTSAEDKLRFRAQRHGSVNQGYFPMKQTSDIHPDLVEGWVFCRRAFDLDAGRPLHVEKFWPRPEAERFFRRLCLAHERLILPLMRSMLTYLGQDPNLYDGRLSGTNFGLRLNYYPPMTSDDAESGAGRLLGHEDVDLFTLLPAPQVEGLQVLNRSNLEWIRLDAPRGELIVNTGDYMQRITNDRFPSTTHRVAQPRDPSLRGSPRVSFPMNVYLWEDETLEVLPGLGEPRYEPVKAQTFHTRITSKYYGDDYAVEE